MITQVVEPVDLSRKRLVTMIVAKAWGLTLDDVVFYGKRDRLTFKFYKHGDLWRVGYVTVRTEIRSWFDLNGGKVLAFDRAVKNNNAQKIFIPAFRRGRRIEKIWWTDIDECDCVPGSIYRDNDKNPRFHQDGRLMKGINVPRDGGEPTISIPLSEFEVIDL